MSRSRFVIAATLLVGALALIALTGCSKGSTPGTTETAAAAESTAATTPSPAIGKTIYATGVGVKGEQILVEAPASAQAAMTVGGGGCAGCHGTNGHGAKVVTGTGTAVDAPNITYAVLTKAGFNDNSIRGAFLYCLDEASQPLGPNMPCWQMNDVEAASTLAYLKTLK